MNTRTIKVKQLTSKQRKHIFVIMNSKHNKSKQRKEECSAGVTWLALLTTQMTAAERGNCALCHFGISVPATCRGAYGP